MAKQMRKAINFDLDTKKLKDAYCVTNRPLEYLKAYGEIKDFMKSKGFLHRQWSGYVSKEPLGFKPLISFSIALSMTLISFLKVSMQLKELAIDTFKGS